MNTVVINKDELFLNSHLEESAFGKTNYFTLIKENGFVFTNTTKESKDCFTPWSFNGVTTKPSTNDKTYVYYNGSNPLSENSHSLSFFFDNKENSEALNKAVKLCVKAITIALKNDVSLPLVGGEGILIDLEKDKVLFLPESIFKYSTNVLSDEEYYKCETAWLNATIKDKAALSYQRALIVYRLLTSQFPYKAIDEEERNADILDKNFLPLEVCYPSLDEKFIKEINKSLMLNSTTVDIPGKKRSGVDSSALTINPDFDFVAFDNAIKVKEESGLTDKELEKKIDEYLTNKKTKVEAQRKLRRNRTAFLIALIIGAVIVIMTISGVKRQNSFYTTMGHNPTELIQNFFYGVNNKELDVLQAISHGDKPDKYVSKITEVFLTEKQITGFTKDTPFFNPSEWLINITNNERFNIAKVFGVSNLMVDNIPLEMENTLYRKNENPEIVVKDNGEVYEMGEKESHNVSYYLIQTDMENQNILVSYVTETHTFTFNNGKWLFTDMTSNSQKLDVDTEKFKASYFSSLSKFDGDVIKACDAIRKEYPFIPSSLSIQEALNNVL